jgi:hypothetical protein
VSAPSDVVYRHFGFSKENLAMKAKEVIAFYSSSTGGGHPVAPSLIDFPRFSRIPPLH